ncbi:DUF5801 repeats-in-toxin domain-containing protein, partial [Malaciobacter pacificus]
DDGPTASTATANTAVAELDETGGLDTVTIIANDVTGLFNSDGSYGQDGEGTTRYSLNATTVNTGLFLVSDQAHANEIVLESDGNGGYIGKAGTTEAFSVAINATTGEIIVIQKEELDHPLEGSNHNDELNLDAAGIKVVQTITDQDNDSVTTTSTNALDIEFLDDGPTAVNDSKSVEEGAVKVTGNVITNDTQGADGAVLKDFTYTDGTGATVSNSINFGIDLTTPTGTLKVNQDGSWEFTPISSVDHDDSGTLGSFTYTLIDGDGDISNSATNTITVTDTTPKVGTVATVSVDEDDLPTIGTSPDNNALTVESSLEITAGQDAFDTIFDITEGAVSGLTSNGSQIYYWLDSTSKVLTASTSSTESGVNSGNTIFTDTLSTTTAASAKHTFVLSGVIDHDNADGQNTKPLTFNYDVIDIDGSKADGSFIVNIIDDIPEAKNDNQSTPKTVVENASAISGNVITNINDDGADVGGADSNLKLVDFTYDTNQTYTFGTSDDGTDANGAYKKVTTANGTLKVWENGDWLFTPNASVDNSSGNVNANFDYTIEDYDGDESSATQYIDILDGADPVVNNINNPDIVVKEGDSKIVFDNTTQTYTTYNTSGYSETIPFSTTANEHILNFTQGTDKAGIVEFTFAGTTKTILEDGSNTVTSAADGTLKVYYNGNWEYTPPSSFSHPGTSGSDDILDDLNFTYVVKDVEGDEASVTGSQNITIMDTAPSIGANEDMSVSENDLQGLTGNSVIVDATTDGTDTTGSLGITKLQDSIVVTFDGITDKQNSGLTSSGDTVYYHLNGDTLTAATTNDDTAITNANTVFVLNLNDTTSASANYDFKLYNEIDHSGADDVNKTITFGYKVTDSDGDVATSNFDVTIVDSTPEASPAIISTNEDTAVTFFLSDEAFNGGITVGNSTDQNGNAVTVSATTITSGGSITLSGNIENATSQTIGTLTNNGDGSLTFTPTADYSGTPSFNYTVTDNDGDTASGTVDINVLPIVDDIDYVGIGATLESGKYKLTDLDINEDNLIDGNSDGQEDSTVKLDLSIPNPNAHLGESDGSEENVDVSQITISDIAIGATIEYKDGSNADVSFTASSGNTSVTILVANNSTNVKYIPVADTNVDNTLKYTFTVTDAPDNNNDSTTDKEHDGTTDLLDTKEFTLYQDINISGVADDTTIGTTSQTGDEDTWLDIDSFITSKSFGDSSDGSETHIIRLEIAKTEFPDGDIPTFKYSGKSSTNFTLQDGKYVAEIPEDKFTSAQIKMPSDYSGSVDIDVFAISYEDDWSNIPTGILPSTHESISELGYDESKSTVSISFTPDANDSRINSAGNTGSEDTKIDMNISIDMNRDDDGSETISSAKISSLPSDVKIYDSSDNLLFDNTSTGADNGNTEFILDFSGLNESQKEALIEGLQILPPAHSSADLEDLVFSLTIEDVTDEDLNAQTNTKTNTFDIIVTPVAERTDSDTAGTVGKDIITQGNHTYTTKANEDEFFDLNTADSGFSLSLTNEDSVETTTVLFTPKDGSGNELDGTIFKYGTTELTYNGTAIEIPVSELSNLEVKAPAEYSGKLVLTTEVKSIDYDDDASGKETANTQTSSGDTLTIIVEPVADTVTVAIKQSFGNEDAGRNDNGASGIPLNIGITSADDSETYDLRLNDIPDGAQIYYNGTLYTNPSPGSTWTLDIESFDNAGDLRYVPEENSNENITLNVQAKSTDAVTVDGNDITDDTSFIPADGLDVLVNVKGVGDKPTHATLATETITDTNSNSNTYNKIVAEDTDSILLKDLFDSSTPNFTSVDTDGSESLFVTITGVPAGFDISSPAVLLSGSGTSREWLVEKDNFDSVTLVIPENYSGEVNSIKLKLQTIEDDGNKSTITTVDTSILVTPEIDGSINKNTTQNEDTIQTLAFAFNNGGDSNEALTSLQIDTDSISLTGVSLFKNGIDITGNGWVNVDVDSDVITASIPADLDTDYSFPIRYTMSDTTNDSSSYTDTTIGDSTYDSTNTNYTTATYNVTVNAVTDTATFTLDEFTDIDGDGTNDITYNSGTQTVTVNANTKFQVPLHLTADDMASESSNGQDLDSETISNTVTLYNVPSGIYVNDGTYYGNGIWSVEISDDLTLDQVLGEVNKISFEVGNTNYPNINQEITINISHQDVGADVLTNTQTFTLVIDGDTFSNTDTGDITPIDLEVSEKIPTNLTEDRGTPLSDLVEVADGIVGNDTGDFVILVSNLNGATISGMQLITQNGNSFYSLPGDGTYTDIQTALESITITPNSNENINTLSNVTFDFSIETIGTNNTNTYDLSLDKQIAPVTDETVINISGSDVDENSSDNVFTISLSNDADGTRTQIIDGKVYLQLSDNGNGGTFVGDNFTLPSVTTIAANSVSDDQGNSLPAGDYYVIENVDYTDSLSIKYTPNTNVIAQDVIDIKAYTISKEDPESSPYTTQTLLSSQTATYDIKAVNDDITDFNPSANGNEDEVVNISLPNTVELNDNTESITSVILKDIPFGYKVTYDGAEVTGTPVGVDANGDYIYEYSFLGISDITTDIAKIGIEKVGVENFNGTISDAKLSISYGETGIPNNTVTENFDIVFNPVADELISFNPTDALGDEYVDSSSPWTKINLNTNVKDVDGSETVYVEFTNLPDGTTFSLDNGSTTIAASNISYDSDTGKYTVANIPYDQINSLYIQTPTGYKGGTITVDAWTVESSNNDTSTKITGKTFDIELESKASGVTSFTSTVGNEVNTTISGKNVVSSGYEISLTIDSLDLLDKDGSESLFVKLSGLGNSFDVDASNLTGVTATKVGSDWIVDIGSATDSHYADAITALSNGNLKLVSTTTSGTVNTINVSAYSELDDGSKSSETTVSNVALNTTVDTTEDMDGTANNDIIQGSSNADTINGQGGDDEINGGSGNDVLNGGNGVDTIDGGAGADIINGDGGNDTINFDGSDTVDGGTGTDTLVLDSGIDLSDVSNISNIEKIDLTQNGDHDITGLSLQDVIDMTDSDNDLEILGDASDNVQLVNEAGKTWSTNNVVDGDGNKTYTNIGDASVTLKIDQDININII